MKLTCPRCGRAPVMTPMRKAILFYRSVPRCPWCGTPLSNPSWFDLGRFAVMFGVLLLSARFFHFLSKSLLFLIFVGMYVLTGLISLYCIPLQKHWNRNDDN